MQTRLHLKQAKKPMAYSQLYTSHCRRLAPTVGLGVEVRPSLIPGAGAGLFTTRPFAAGELVTGMEGKIITHQEAEELKKLGLHTHVRTLISHCLCLDGLRTFPAPQGVGGGSYCNDANGSEVFLHCGKRLTNNAELLQKALIHGSLSVCFVRATQPIATGEEVLVAYGRAYWGLEEEIKQELLQQLQQKQHSNTANSALPMTPKAKGVAPQNNLKSRMTLNIGQNGESSSSKKPLKGLQRTVKEGESDAVEPSLTTTTPECCPALDVSLCSSVTSSSASLPFAGPGSAFQRNTVTSPAKKARVAER